MVDLRNEFQPDYAVLPGEMLEYELEIREMKVTELSDRAGITQKHIIDITKGRSAITPNVARRLESVLGMPARYWLNLVAHYQEDLERIAFKEECAKDIEWLKRMPLKEMIRFGWLKEMQSKADQMAEVLQFFGVVSVAQWQVVWSKKSQQAAYRQTQNYEILPEAVTSWLRQGEIQAAQIQTEPYDKARFKAVLPDIRSVTLNDADNFVDDVTRLCASAGVAVVFVPMLAKTGISGATHGVFNKPVIQLSLRGKTNDRLWFTFFHEAGHILLHGKKHLFLERDKNSDLEQCEKEREADEFAQNVLIPQRLFEKFISEKDFTSKSIVSFADDIGIAPGIVVGQLQHLNLVPWSRFNELKVSYEWA